MDTDQDKNKEDEIITYEQLYKSEPPLEDAQLSNRQTVKKTIKSYETRISELVKLTQKQKKHNETLKDQLRQLNDSLNSVISKVGQKGFKQDDNNNSKAKDDVLKKELENEIKKNVTLQKEVLTLRTKVKLIDGTKLTELHNQLKQKEKQIEEMNSTIKTYAKAQKIDKNMDIYRRQQQLKNKVNLLNQEILFLKKKHNEHKKHQETQEKSIKRQHQQIISLEIKYKTTQNGMSSSVSPQKGFGKSKDKETSRSEQEVQKLKNNLESLESTKRAAEKVFRQQIENLKIRNKIIEKELEEAKDMLGRKEKQLNILTSRLKQLQRKRDHKTLEPVEIGRKSQDFSLSGLFDQRKQFKGLMHFTNTTHKFDDTQSLPLQKTYKIKKLTFSWFQQHILSLKTQYQLSESSLKQLSTFDLSHSYQNTKSGSLTFNEFQYIKDIEIYCSKWIEFIRIKTSRDQILEVGSDRNYTKCKKFTFDIRTNQKPIAFLGAFETKKMLGSGSEGKQMLISFGLEIKKKQVTGKGAKFGGSRNPGRTESIRKHPSKSVFDYSGKNDKNIIPDDE